MNLGALWPCMAICRSTKQKRAFFNASLLIVWCLFQGEECRGKNLFVSFNWLVWCSKLQFNLWENCFLIMTSGSKQLQLAFISLMSSPSQFFCLGFFVGCSMTNCFSLWLINMLAPYTECHSTLASITRSTSGFQLFFFHFLYFCVVVLLTWWNCFPVVTYIIRPISVSDEPRWLFHQRAGPVVFLLLLILLTVMCGT